MLSYSKIVKPIIQLRKLKQRKKKRKTKDVWVKHQCRNYRWWRDMWSLQSTFHLWKKNQQGHPPFKSGISICACCCNMLACVVSHFVFHQTFPHSIFVTLLLFFVNLHKSELIDGRINGFMRRAGLVNRAGWLLKNKPARQNEPARFQLTSCNSETISTELTTDCHVGFKIMQNSVNESANLV